MSWFNYRPIEQTRKDQVLRKGVISINRETGARKIGDGVTPWAGLEEIPGVFDPSEFHPDSGDGGGSGGGSGGPLGPFTIDASKLSPQELFDGVKLTTLVPGSVIRDISWRIPVPWTGPEYPDTGNWGTCMTALGTSEVNFMLAPYGNGWDGNQGSNGDVLDSNWQFPPWAGELAVGDWLLPNDTGRRSLLNGCIADSYLDYWNDGLHVPETADLDLIVKVKACDFMHSPIGTMPINSIEGITEFYVHT